MPHGSDPARPDHARAESGIQTVILLAVAGMAGAASFTHVHDWTMHNSPPGTPHWFGWANAMVTELIPIAAGLEIRRLRRKGLPIGRYPITLILAAVAVSLAGQFAEAKPGPSGWLISAIPALGFLALVKLVLSRPATVATARPATAAPVPAAIAQPEFAAIAQPEFAAKTSAGGDAKTSAEVNRTVGKSAVTRTRIHEIAAENPTATPAQIAAAAGVSESTARRYLPSKPPGRVNGAERDLTFV